MTTLRGPEIDGHRAVLHLHEPAGAGPVDGVVVVLHGGRAHGLGPTTATQLSVLRLVPFDWATRASARRAGARVAVARLRFRVRGWNGERRDPVRDARWALAALRERYGDDVGFTLVGHSMGGRTAMTLAGDPGVLGVVGLAPWLGPQDRVPDVRGRRILVVHGTADHMTDPAGSRDWADRARAAGAAVTYVAVPRAGHPMLRRPWLWHRLAAGFAVAALTAGRARPRPATRQDASRRGTAHRGATNLVQQALAGVPFARA